MKKLLAVFLLFAVLFSATACGKIYFDEEKYSSQIAKDESEKAESSSKQVEEISENKDEVESELGKTKKNQKIVVKLTYGDHMEYVATYFKNGVVSYRDTYKYFDTESYYEMVLGYGDVGNDKVIDTDDNLRLIVYRNKDVSEMDFESCLSLYERKDTEICEVIE